METERKIRERRSLLELQDEYMNGNQKPLEDLMRAWKGVKELPPTDPNSFFVLGGLHGEPFRGAGWGSSIYWGGYCNHGNILFPTWHRVYVLKLEEALQSIPGCADVMMPFWDETSPESLQNGIPWALTRENFELDGVSIPNPLRSFVFNQNIQDNINGDTPNYSKPKGYETVRYPLAGLVGTAADRAATTAWNKLFDSYDQCVEILNDNIKDWLNSEVDAIDSAGNVKPTGFVHKKYVDCLNAPNYTVFSNTTSAQQWNSLLDSSAASVVALESPHNSIHLATGGFSVPKQSDYDGKYKGANGDMGENDTAALDPIFYFHHCFIDRVFWLWQQKHGFTDRLEIMPEYPGTNSVDSQGPTPGIVPNSWLTLDTPLNPFKKPDGCAYTSRDCINIERQLGYKYGHGSLEDHDRLLAAAALQPGQTTRRIRISGVNRASIPGSFLISAFVNIGGKRHHVGTEAVLSRWSVQGCANCQTHLEVKAFFDLQPLKQTLLKGAQHEIQAADCEIEICPHASVPLPDVTRPRNLNTGAILLALQPTNVQPTDAQSTVAQPRKPFHLEVW